MEEKNKKLDDCEKYKKVLLIAKRIKIDIAWFMERLREGMSWRDYHDANRNGPHDLTEEEFSLIEWWLMTKFDEEKYFFVRTREQTEAEQLDKKE